MVSKKNFEENLNDEPPFEDTNFDYYIEVIAKKDGIIRVWSDKNPIVRWNIEANKLTKVPIPDDTWRTEGNFHHFIQTGGDQIDTTFIDLTGLGKCNMYNITTMFQGANTVETINFGQLEFASTIYDEYTNTMFEGCSSLIKIVCKQSVKDFILSSSKIKLPNNFINNGTWEIIL